MEDKLFEFVQLTEKKVSLDKICTTMNISKVETLGLKKMAREEGFNIISEQTPDGIVFYNQGEITETKNDRVKFDTDENNNFKFMVISNTMLGSKSEQLSVLNDLYKKAYSMGITTVIHCGNLSAGTYPITSPYHDSNFIADKEGQIVYIIENFPKIEGITTYFITSKREDSKSKVSVGNRVQDGREDMIYLGSTSCDFNIDNGKVKVISSPLAQTYTTSYRPQQFAKSFRSEDKPDILLLGGLNQLDHITYREVCVLSVPSLCATTKEMADKRYSNTVGAYIVDVHTDEKGKIQHDGVKFISIPYYVTCKDDYLRANSSPVVRKSCKPEEKDDEIGRSVAEKYYKRIKNGKSVDEFKLSFHLNDSELMGIIELCNMYGLFVDMTIDDSGYLRFVKGLPKELRMKKPDIDANNLIHSEYLLVSDTHLCNIHQQLHLLNDMYKEAYERGITKVFHVGDVVDGFYQNRKPYPVQQFLYNFNDQLDYVIDMYPYVDGLTTYYITGNHDMTHFRNGGASIDHCVSKLRSDLVHLGQDLGEISFDKVKFRLDHPGNGSGDSLSYQLQKRIEIIPSGEKPNIYLCGHYHKSYYMLYRNVHAFAMPALCAKTSFEHTMGLNNYLGGYFIDVYSDKKTGNVEYLGVEEKIYDKKDIWDENKKDKKRVKKLIIK